MSISCSKFEFQGKWIPFNFAPKLQTVNHDVRFHTFLWSICSLTKFYWLVGRLKLSRKFSLPFPRTRVSLFASILPSNLLHIFFCSFPPSSPPLHLSPYTCVLYIYFFFSNFHKPTRLRCHCIFLISVSLSISPHASPQELTEETFLNGLRNDILFFSQGTSEILGRCSSFKIPKTTSFRDHCYFPHRTRPLE